MGLDQDGYYTLRDILGYNCKYNMVLSDRGRGKSYAAKRFLMEQPGTCMCLYRSSFDMASGRSGWLEDLDKLGYNLDAFEWVGSDKEGWILDYNGSHKAWFRYISQVNHIKQESFPDDMNWVWWDEFIPLAYKKLAGVPSEGDALRAIVKTIEHDSIRSREDKGLKPVRVLMFANPFTWNNPVLSYFHVIPRVGIWRAGPGVAVEMLASLPKARRNTVDGFLGDEVNKNQGWMDSMHFVRAIPKGADFQASMRIGDSFYHRYKHQGKSYVSKGTAHKGLPSQWYGSQDGLREQEHLISRSFADFLKKERYATLYYADVNVKYDYQRDIGLL